MSVLITGCAGLLGSHFSKYLLNNGVSVVGIDNLSGGYLDFVDPRLDFCQMDLNDVESLNEIFETKIQRSAIFMCSRECEFQLFEVGPEEFKQWEEKWAKRVEEFYNLS